MLEAVEPGVEAATLAHQAGVVAVLAYPLPFRLGLLVAVAAGIAAGIAWERWTR